MGRAFEQIWDVPRLEQRVGIAARVRGVAVLAAMATALLGATAAAGLTVGGGLGEGAQGVAALAGALAGNLVTFFIVFAVLTGRGVRVRALVPGVIAAAVGALVLQALGGWYVDAAVARATDTYGMFALVIGLLSWFCLGVHALLAAAELNVVLAGGLWPRTLAGALSAADRRALEDSAHAAQRDERERIAVTFDTKVVHTTPPPDGPIVAVAGRTEDAPTPSYHREPPP